MPVATIPSVSSLLLREAGPSPSVEVLVLLREHWKPLLIREGLIDASSGQAALDRWTCLAFRIVRTLADHPFETQSAIARDLGLSAEVLVRLNRVLRQSDLAQQLIVQHGQAAKYWQNTIVPLARSGALMAARRHERRHPCRVGLYVGRVLHVLLLVLRPSIATRAMRRTT